MGGDRGGGGELDQLPAAGLFPQIIQQLLQKRRVLDRVVDVDEIGLEGIQHRQLVVQEIVDALAVDAAVLLAHVHKAVLNDNLRPQLQNVRAQGGHRGAASALAQKLQGFDDEASVDALAVGLQMAAQRLRVLDPAAGRLEDQQGAAAGEVLGVHHPDVTDLLGRDAGVVVAAGDPGALGDVDHRLSLGCQPAEPGLIVGGVRRAGLGQLSAAADVAQQILLRDVRPVLHGPIAHRDVACDDAQADPVDHFCGHIHRAVRG